MCRNSITAATATSTSCKSVTSTANHGEQGAKNTTTTDSTEFHPQSSFARSKIGIVGSEADDVSTTAAAAAATTAAGGRPFFHFQASLAAHLFNIFIIILFIAALRSAAIKALVRPILNLLPNRRFHDIPSGEIFQPLSWMNWLIHFMPMVVNFEIMSSFHRLAALSKKNGNEKNRAIYRALYVVYIKAHIQGLLDVAAHAQIGVSDSIEKSLVEWGALFMKIHVFGAGTSILFGEWSMLPVAGLVAGGVLDMKNPAGICLCMLSLMTVLWRKELPLGFKAAWIVLCALPPFSTNTKGSDLAHLQFVAILSMTLMVLTYSVQLKVWAEENAPSTSTDTETTTRPHIKEEIGSNEADDSDTTTTITATTTTNTTSTAGDEMKKSN